jgi:anthranilate synthase / indole-3-glycerol phosphate synthase / phosphoribosylanthranilate isomerase
LGLIIGIYMILPSIWRLLPGWLLSFPDWKDVVLCALSGISTRADLERLRGKVDAVLVGEVLMRAENPTAFIANLFNLPELSGGGTPPPPLVKICGIRTVERRSGVRTLMLILSGFVFVPGSKRVVSVDDASRIASVMNESRSSLDQTETETGVEMEMAPWFTTHIRSINRERSRGRFRPLLVGVFENATVEMIREAVRRVPLDIVQLHGEESIDFARWVGVSVKVFGLGSGGKEEKEERRGDWGITFCFG